MTRKVLSFLLLVACSQALQDHGATSSVSFNELHNTVHHIHSAPALIKTVAAPIHAAPLAAPVYAAPHAQALSYSPLSLGHSGPAPIRYTAPVTSLSHHAAPSIQYAAPSFQYAAPSYQYSAPSLQYTAPTAKVASPVLVNRVAPGHYASSYSSLALGHIAPAAHHVLGGPVSRGVAPLVAPPLQGAAAPVVHVAPEVHSGAALHGVGHYEEYAHPKYEFAYDVQDHHTGDIHSHKEARDGDLTQGEYSLHEADGTVRIVKYSVDKHSGFNAVVERAGHATHAQPVLHKGVVAAPVLTKSIVAAPAYNHYHG